MAMVELSSSQLKAATFDCTPNSILSIQAGPGSGKTLTLVHRIKHLIQTEGIKPEEIIVLSMTNRTVNSVRASLQAILGEQPQQDEQQDEQQEQQQQVKVRTFHSFSSYLIDSYLSEYFPNQTRKVIMDDISWKSFREFFLKASNSYKKIKPTELERLLVTLKNGETTIDKVAQQLQIPETKLNETLQYLQDNGMIRYSDLISDALKILDQSLQINNNPIEEIKNIKVIIVDEFQDMQPSLLKLVDALSNYPHAPDSIEKKHITIAGDMNQCIYGFLGSNPDITQEFLTQYRETAWEINELALDKTFRLTPEILTAAIDIALKPCDLHHHQGIKEVTAVKESSYKPTMYSLSSNFDEYNFIASEISRLICESGGLFKFSDFMVLTRTNGEVDMIAKLFNKDYGFNINKYTQSAEWLNTNIHVFLDILNILNNGNGSDFALLSVLLKLGIGKPALSNIFQLYQLWKKNSIGLEEQRLKQNKLEQFLREQLVEATDFNETTKLFKTRLQLNQKSIIISFIQTISQSKAKMNPNSPISILQTLNTIVSSTDLMNYINKLPPSKTKAPNYLEHEQKIMKDLQGFYQSLKNLHQEYEFSDLIVKQQPFIEYFLHNCYGDEPVYDPNAINISTVHKAKGLEFPVVFIPGCKSPYSNYPPWNKIITYNGEPKPDPEDGRLLYVAMTRAKNMLYLGTPFRDSINKSFSHSPPVFDFRDEKNRRFIGNMANDLKRPMAPPERVMAGQQLYSSLMLNGSVRSYHVSVNSLIQPFKRKLII
ncbi:HMI1 [[Candida] subhashii]|uniref:DNA 3'-5' helicase n=1 Tax=[Candida] subhashii TaxID=561895 RepID=A0A8J5QIV7_9ASCO|nr:HMI1 [[Candida] subhashii]KAG7663852.1 HMI1 [[Candida] subhashii]